MGSHRAHRWAIFDKPYVPALTFFFAGTILAAAASLWVLDAIPHVQDEVGYIFQGKIFSLGRSYVPTPPGPEFFTNGFIQMFDGKWFAKYPPGFPLLLVPGLLAGLPWLIDPLCAGVSLTLIYATGLRLFDRPTANWAAFLGLVSPWIVFMSASYMSHPSTMMWTALFLYALVCARSPGSAPQPDSPGTSKIANRKSKMVPSAFALIAGFALGMAFITRQWTAAGIGVGVALWALGDIALARGPDRWRKLRTYLLVPVGMLPPILVILYENRQLTGDILRFTQDLVGSYDQPGFGPGHGDAIGHTPALGVYNALVYWRSLGTIFDGWPVPFALAPLLLGAVAWVRDRDRTRLGHDALLWMGTLGLVGAYFLWWSNTTIFGPRYWYEAMPFLLLIAGRGLDLLGKVAYSTLPANPRPSLRWAVPAAIFAFFTIYTLTQSIPYWSAFFTDYNGIPSEPLRSAQAAHLKNALVFVALDPAKPNRDYGKVFAANDPLLRGDIVFARDLGAAKNRSLLPLFPGRQPYYLPLTGPPVPGFGP